MNENKNLEDAIPPGWTKMNENKNIPPGHPLRNLIQAVAEAVDGQYKNKMQNINALLMFGPAHGQTMVVQNCDILIWQDSELPLWDMTSRHLECNKQMHRYRREDDYESSNMEECTIFVHSEHCCDVKMPTKARDEKQRAIRIMPPGPELSWQPIGYSNPNSY